jgi:hypothetical protein
VDGQPEAIPDDYAAATAERERGRGPHLAVALARDLTIDCYFFTPDEIEFSLDPREIRSEREFGLVLSFIELIGMTVKKPVLLTPENGIQYPILIFDAKTNAWMRS